MTLEAVERAFESGPVYCAERGAVDLADYWRDGTAVFIFLRHFG